MDGEITPETVNDLLEDGEETLRIVDIRDATSFDRGRIPDSENVPFHELPQRVEEVVDADDDDVDRIVTVCPHGKASVQAARLIGSYEACADTTVESMAGGLEAWTQECAFELVSGADSGGSGDGNENERPRDDDSGRNESADDSDTPDAPF